MTRPRLGLIGCGGMGSRHAEGFDQLEDRVRVTVAVDIELAARRSRGRTSSTAAAPPPTTRQSWTTWTAC